MPPLQPLLDSTAHQTSVSKIRFSKQTDSCSSRCMVFVPQFSSGSVHVSTADRCYATTTKPHMGGSHVHVHVCMHDA